MVQDAGHDKQLDVSVGLILRRRTEIRVQKINHVQFQGKIIKRCNVETVQLGTTINIRLARPRESEVCVRVGTEWLKSKSVIHFIVGRKLNIRAVETRLQIVILINMCQLLFLSIYYSLWLVKWFSRMLFSEILTYKF